MATVVVNEINHRQGDPASLPRLRDFLAAEISHFDSVFLVCLAPAAALPECLGTCESDITFCLEVFTSYRDEIRFVVSDKTAGHYIGNDVRG